MVSPAFSAIVVATHDSRDITVQEQCLTACAHAATLFSRLADSLAWLQAVPQHPASVPRKGSVPSTDITRLEPLESAAPTY